MGKRAMPLDTTIFTEADIFVSPAQGRGGDILGYRVHTMGGDVIAVVRHREIAIAIAKAAHREERLSVHLH